MSSLGRWFNENKLTLHPSKCKSILFTTKRKLQKFNKLNIIYNGALFEQCSDVKYLGLRLEQDLSGTKIWERVLSKVNSGLKFLYRKASFLDLNSRKLLANAILQPYFDYACNSWYWGLTKNQKNRLQTMQNKIMRYILNLESEIFSFK